MANALVFPVPFSTHNFQSRSSRFVDLPRRAQAIAIPASSSKYRKSIARAMKTSGGSDSLDPPPKEVPDGTNSVAAPAPPQSWGLPLPTNISVWSGLALGAIVLLALPFYKRILRIGDAVEKAAEKAAEVVEKGAEKVEELAKDVAAVLPDGDVKEKILSVQNIADKVEKNAEIAQIIIHQVDDITDEVEKLAAENEKGLIQEGKTKLDPVQLKGSEGATEEGEETKKVASPSSEQPQDAGAAAEKGEAKTKNQEETIPSATQPKENGGASTQ